MTISKNNLPEGGNGDVLYVVRKYCDWLHNAY